METTNEAIKKTVRETYEKAIKEDEGCCGTGCCGSDSAKTPAPDAHGARTSFGCGDPLALAEIREGQTVLDIGSGPGADALAAARLVGPKGHVIGVDMTDGMLARARKAARASGLAGVEFRHGDAEALPVEDGSVDWVISNCVVNLVPDKKAAFREIFRVLKPGGRFAITDLIGENLPAEVLADSAALCSCIGGAPSESDYLDAARAAGLSRVRVVDRLPWDAPQLAGTEGRVWSVKVAGERPEHAPFA
ncbi:MAG TPA: methyltransferase domain-containing protein [Candidatus Polarisedimenticolia bacterium]|nr:methyltransferase domain-containing protein [Candidatus Polarisedimenticolia bacterium]